jgi:6-phosphofructokinase 1
VSKVRVGVLTGGGDCPGLNAVIRAIVRKGETIHGDEIIGFLDAWDGVLGHRTMPLDVASLRGMLPRGGTLLGTKRGSPFDFPDGPERTQQVFADQSLDGLIVIGGNGSLTVACRLHELLDLPIIGVPKTIDNDILGTEVTFGFHTAVQVATDAIDRLHTTAESHDRVMVVEVMGRHTGWIATYAGIAGGATVILVPELPFDIDEVCEILLHRHRRGRYASIVVVAEGAEPREGTRLEAPQREIDRFGHAKLGGIANLIAPAIEERTGFETRVVSLGHVQRGGTPTAYDRVLSTRYGLAAIDAVHDKAWGEMVVYREMRIERAPLRLALGRTRTLDLAMYEDVASIFFG